MCSGTAPEETRKCEDRASSNFCCSSLSVCINPDGSETPNAYMNENCALACCCVVQPDEGIRKRSNIM